MATYGTKYLQFAPFGATDPDILGTAYPKYGTPVNVGKLVKVTDSPTYNSAKIYGDDVLDESIDEFKEAGVDVEVTELSNEVAKAVLGASLLTESPSDLEFGDSDTAPYGGLAFFSRKVVNHVKKFKGIYYPKVQATMQGEEYSTKGDSITLASSKLHFTAYACAKGKWKVHSQLFATEAEAKAWVDAKVAAAT